MIPRPWFRKQFARPAANPIRPSAKEAVMRTLMAVVVPAVGVLVYTALPAAAEEGSAEKAGGELVARVQDLDLTDAQEAKIADIRKENRPKVQEAAKDLTALLKEEEQKVMAVLTPDQKAKIAAMKEERDEFRDERLAERIAHLKDLDLTEGEKAKLMEIRKECHPKTVKALQGLEGLLTQEQKTARVKALDAGMKRKEVASLLGISEAAMSLKLNGDTNHTLTSIDAFCGTVGVELTFRLGGEHA